jgi:hypothetical protein
MSAHNSSAATEMRPPVLEDIDVLLALARDLATITSVASLRDALAGPLRPLLPSHDISVLRAVGRGTWEALSGPEDAVERLHEYSWTPLVADHKTIGNVGMGAPAVGAPTGKLADAIGALVAAIALKAWVIIKRL